MEFIESAASDVSECSELSIKDLSDDVLLEIFNRLDKTALKQSSRVCQRWRNLIVNSTTLTQRLTLFLTTDRHTHSPNEYIIQFNKFLKSEAAEFPYRNFKVIVVEPKDMETWSKIQDIFFKLVIDPLKLELDYVPPPVAIHYIQLSASTLTHLNLNYDSDETCIFDLPFELPNLVSLRLFQTYIPRSLYTPKLAELRYHKVRKNSTPFTLNLEDFLIRSVNLKKLDTCSIPKFDRNVIKFQLEELSISSNELELETFKNFMISQQKSLKKLEFFDEKVEYREFVNVIIQHTRIEELNLISRYNTSNVVPEVEEFNNSIKKLSICLWPVRSFYVQWPHADYIIGMLKKFRGLENLTLMSMDKFETIFEQVDFSNLKTLYLRFRKGNDFKKFKFGQFQLEKMEELKINEIAERQDVEDLLKVASFCPNLKIMNLGKLTYIIKKTEFIKMSHFETLFKYSPNIVDLVVEGCSHLLSSFMFSIKTVKSNLLRLKVGVYCEDRIPKMLGKLHGAKFVCDIHYHKIVGMKPVPWFDEQLDCRKKQG